MRIVLKWQKIKINVKFVQMDIFQMKIINVVQIQQEYPDVVLIKHKIYALNVKKVCMFKIINVLNLHKVKKLKIVYIMIRPIIVKFVSEDLLYKIFNVFKDLQKIV